MRWPSFLSSWKSYTIAGVLIIGALVALDMTSFDLARLSIKDAMRYDTSLNASLGRIEAEKLKAALAGYLTTRDEEDQSYAKLQLAIVKSRLVSWGKGEFGQFVKADAGREQKRQQALQLLGELDAHLSRSLTDAEVREFLANASELAGLIHTIGAEAHYTSINQAASAREKLQHQQHIQRWISDSLMALGGLLLLVAIRQNISLRKTSELADANARKFAHLAKHDPVTGLPNRTAVDEKLKDLKEIASTAQEPRRICVIAADLDGFKRINDLMGHVTGDAALRAVGRQLSAAVERSGIPGMVARVGGDEFLIFLEPGEKEWSSSGFTRALLRTFDKPLDTGGVKVNLGLSIGYAESYCVKEACVHLVMNADLALTEAKSRGKRRAVAYNKALRIQLERREAVEDALPAAIGSHEIFPVYQPCYDIQTGICAGFEALSRWNHPKLGQINPDEFIPIAETTGDIVDIGRYILRQACQEAAGWERDAAISVNLSMVQILRSDIVEEVRHALSESGLDPRRLKLEITESVLISDLERTVAVLKKFQAMGIRISLDDFGTGYSGLSYLTKFAWDEIKIDKSFVVSAGASPEVRKVVKMVVKIATQLGAMVTIEGIESEDQRLQFAGFGCNTAQGYYFGRPEGHERIRETLHRKFASLEDMASLYRLEQNG